MAELNKQDAESPKEDALISDLLLLREELQGVQDAPSHPGGPYPTMKEMQSHSKRSRALIDRLVAVCEFRQKNESLLPELSALPRKLKAFVESSANKEATIFPTGPAKIAEVEREKLTEKGPFFDNFSHDDLIGYCDEIFERLGHKRLPQQLIDILAQIRILLQKATTPEDIQRICEAVTSPLSSLNNGGREYIDITPFLGSNKEQCIETLEQTESKQNPNQPDHSRIYAGHLQNEILASLRKGIDTILSET